jgi:hypothetical protein
LDALVVDNNLSEIQKCYDGGHALEQDLAKALKAAEGHHWSDAITALEEFAAALPAEFTTCENLLADVTAIKSWAKIFSSKIKLAETIAKNMIMHRKKIEADVTLVKNDWNAQKYFDSGKAAGDALIVALGPVKTADFEHGKYL